MGLKNRSHVSPGSQQVTVAFLPIPMFPHLFPHCLDLSFLLWTSEIVRGAGQDQLPPGEGPRGGTDTGTGAALFVVRWGRKEMQSTSVSKPDSIAWNALTVNFSLLKLKTNVLLFLLSPETTVSYRVKHKSFQGADPLPVQHFPFGKQGDLSMKTEW